MEQTTHKKRKHWLWWVALFVLAVAIALVIFWLDTKNVADSHTPACAPQDLTLSTASAQGTAGTVFMDAVVTNKSKRTCTLKGYPSVALVDSKGVRLGNDAQANNLYGEDTVAITPGAAAHSVVGFPDPGVFGAGVCSAKSASLRVYLPNNASAALTTGLQQQACPGFSATTFQPGA